MTGSWQCPAFWGDIARIWDKLFKQLFMYTELLCHTQASKEASTNLKLGDYYYHPRTKQMSPHHTRIDPKACKIHSTRNTRDTPSLHVHLEMKPAASANDWPEELASCVFGNTNLHFQSMNSLVNSCPFLGREDGFKCQTALF